jgi:hypothetical protein
LAWLDKDTLAAPSDVILHGLLDRQDRSLHRTDGVRVGAVRQRGLAGEATDGVQHFRQAT